MLVTSKMDVHKCFDTRPFEDTIDGYFPLHVSLAQMLDRHGFAAALVTIEHAPIMHIPGLSIDAPVPLNLRDGFAGIIDIATFCVTRDAFSGVGTWRWLTDGAANFDATTRLAEPCFVTGQAFAAGTALSPLVGAVARADCGLSCVDTPPRDLEQGTQVWGPFVPDSLVDLRQPLPKRGHYFLRPLDT